MSTYTCPVLRLGKIGANPNADSLSVFNGPQGPIQFKNGQFSEGDLIAFIPADSIVDLRRPEFSFLAGGNEVVEGKHEFRVRGVRLRGIPSVGIALPAPEGLSEGDNAAEYFGCKKHEGNVHSVTLHSTAAKAPNGIATPVYDVENHWNVRGDAQIIGDLDMAFTLWSLTEKIHGCNFRSYIDGNGEIHVGSRNRWVSSDNSVWWRAFRQNEDALRLIHEKTGWLLYGEVYGAVQDLHYGLGAGEVKLAIFDAYDTRMNQFVAPSTLYKVLFDLSLTGLYVPSLGMVNGDLDSAIAFAQERLNTELGSKSVICPKQIAEGIVIRPWGLETRLVRSGARVITKVISPLYLSRKNGTEYH